MPSKPPKPIWDKKRPTSLGAPKALSPSAKSSAKRAAQKAEADLMRAQNAATFTHKEYPEAGFRWVELRQPEAEKITQLPEGWRVLEDSNAGQKYHYVVNEHGGTIPGSGFIGKTPEEAIANTLKGLNARRETQALEDALKYEGETMGHCVGGYCEEVAAGQSRIYSLRDKKGQPHVTIEVRPGKDKTGLLTAEELPPEVLADMKARNVYDPNFMYRFNEKMGRHLPELGPFEPEIVQIKGKANRAPNPEYLPAVQDFVRSQNWSNVGDLKNTGLVDLQQMGVPAEMRGGQRFVTEDEYKDIVRKNVEGFAEGGLVGGANFPTYDFDPARIDSIVGELHAMNAG